MINIFIVDDDTQLLKLYQLFLTFSGFSVIDSAINGEEAVTKFKNLQKKPDLIIMDFNMPIKNGIEATKEIVRIDKNAKIIIVSGEISIKEEAINVGAISFYKKPFNLTEFCQKLVNIYEILSNSEIKPHYLNQQLISH